MWFRRSTVTHHLALKLPWLLALVVYSLSSCSWPRQIKALSTENTTIKTQMTRQQRDLEQFKTQSREMWAAASCSIADRDLFDKLRKECPPDNKVACSTVQIYPALRRRGGLQSLFYAQKFRESFYIPRDAQSLPPFRKERLEKLVRQGPLFDSTRFVIVVRTDPDEKSKEEEASKRSEIVVEELTSELLKARRDELANSNIGPNTPAARKAIENFIWRWRYDAALKLTDLETIDRPQTGLGEPGNINRGIWIFRVDC